MTRLSERASSGFLCGVIAAFFFSTAHCVEEQESEQTSAAMPESILGLELSDTDLRSVKRVNDDEGVPSFRCARPLAVRLYKPTRADLDGDGRMEIVSGFQFLNKGELWRRSKDRDFLAVYATDQDGRLKRRFRKTFDRSDRGYFADLWLDDLTGDGKPEICLRYNFADAGARLWNWKEILYILRAGTTLDILLELPVREGWGNVKGEGHARRSELKFEDLDGDGSKEILVHTDEEKDDDHANEATETPVTYGLVGGQYKKIAEPPKPNLKHKNACQRTIQRSNPEDFLP